MTPNSYNFIEKTLDKLGDKTFHMAKNRLPLSDYFNPHVQLPQVNIEIRHREKLSNTFPFRFTINRKWQ
jgi:hypothetical protein